MPMLGLGVWQVPNGPECVNAVRWALESGYRHIDTVFIHTPDNADALELARRFHDDVRGRVPEVEALPEPLPAGPPTLF